MLNSRYGLLENAIVAREARLKLGDEMETQGSRWYRAVIQDDQGNMIGSMAVLDLPSEKELNSYLAQEPHVTGVVWRKVEIHECNVKNP
jgi:hypothetical protein